MTPQLRFPEFTDEWQMKKLGSLADGGLSNGVFNDPKKVGSGYKLINVKDMYVDGFIDSASLTKVAISDIEFERNRVKNGDLFFTRSSLVKEGIAYTNIYLGDENDITFDGHLIKLIPDTNKVNHEFMYYLSKSSTARRQLMRYGTTTTMTTIGQKEVADVDVSIPQKPEQEKIADYMGGVDSKLTSIQTKVAAMHEYKKGVMQALFSGKLRFKDENGDPYPDREEKKLTDIGEIVGGGTPDTSNPAYWNGDIYWLTPTEVKDRYVTLTKRTITKEGLKNCSAKILPIGTIIFTSRATVGDVAISRIPLVTNQGFQSVIVSSDNDNRFVYFWAINNRKVFLRKSSGSTFPEISRSEMKKIDIILPCLEEQQKIADFLTALDDRIELEEAKLTNAKEFKKALLQRMFV